MTPKPATNGAILAACAMLVACDTIWGIPDRVVDPHLVCEDGDCVCVAPFADCTGDGACATNLAEGGPGGEDCGVCGNLCQNGTCTEGACVCNENFADCDREAANGCEGNLREEGPGVAHCGVCGNACDNGTCAGGTCVCDVGFDDCDGDPKNGCETPLATSADHCGACGAKCIGAACEGGACRALVLFEDPAGLTAATVDGDTGYVSTCDAVWAVPLAGGVPSEIAIDGFSCPSRLVVSGDHLFFSATQGTAHRIVSVPLDGSGPPTVIETIVEPDHIFAMAGDPTGLYWVRRLSNPLRSRLSKRDGASGVVTAFKETVIGFEMRARNQRVYWLNPISEVVLVFDQSGSELASLPAEDATGTHFDVGATHMTWLDSTSTIWTRPLSGGARSSVAQSLTAEVVVFDDTSVAWPEGSAVVRAPFGGGGPTVVVDLATEDVFNLVVDERSLYFLTATAFMGVPK